jgi:hypothetical protein
MDPNQPPSLEHGIPDPETYLPGTPDWYWWFLIGGIVLTILALLWFLKLLFQRPEKPQPLAGHDIYTPAIESLDSLASQCGTKLVSEVAAEASLSIRTYLAGSRSEPALYETVEEFQSRQSVLPADANHHLNELNDAKYSKSEVDETRSRGLVKQSKSCLEKLRHFAPTKEEAGKPVSPPLPETTDLGWFRRVVVKRSLAGVPLGGALALVGLLGGTYQRRDAGLEIQGNPLVWVGLSISAIALIIYLTIRPKRSRL